MTSSETQAGDLSAKPEVEQQQEEWSVELLADVDRQYELWAGMLTKITQNLARAGTPKMVVYSSEEREQLQIMVDNMKQLAGCIGGERAKKITTLHGKALFVLGSYDDLTNPIRRYTN